jgi:hypothetical protein
MGTERGLCMALCHSMAKQANVILVFVALHGVRCADLSREVGIAQHSALV